MPVRLSPACMYRNFPLTLSFSLPLLLRLPISVFIPLTTFVSDDNLRWLATGIDVSYFAEVSRGPLTAPTALEEVGHAGYIYRHDAGKQQQTPATTAKMKVRHTHWDFSDIYWMIF